LLFSHSINGSVATAVV